MLTGLQIRKTAIIAQVLTVLRFILHTNFAARRTFARPRASECLRICLCSPAIYFHAAAAAEKKGAAFAAPEFVFCRALTGIAKFVLTVRIGDKSVFSVHGNVRIGDIPFICKRSFRKRYRRRLPARGNQY